MSSLGKRGEQEPLRTTPRQLHAPPSLQPQTSQEEEGSRGRLKSVPRDEGEKTAVERRELVVGGRERRGSGHGVSGSASPLAQRKASPSALDSLGGEIGGQRRVKSGTAM